MGACPLITIGITCFNAEATIERAISSGLAQDWLNFEVLVVDDGSTDSSLSIINRYAEIDSRVRVIRHQVNSGCAAARNTLVFQAQGHFLAFFDDDDVSRSDRLRLQYERIVTYERETGAQMVACYASGERIYPNGYKMPIYAVGSEGFSPVGTLMGDYLLFNKRRRNIFYGAGTPTCSLMARKKVFQTLGNFDAEMRRQEDADFAIRLGFEGGHFIGIPERVLTQYATTRSQKSALIEFESFIQLLDKNADYLRRQKSYGYMRLWSEMRFRHFAGQDLRAIFVLVRLMIFNPVRTLRHFVLSASRRFLHEYRMKTPPNG
jgi:glycosyltransferase involved in cell wall biosynthesis